MFGKSGLPCTPQPSQLSVGKPIPIKAKHTKSRSMSFFDLFSSTSSEPLAIPTLKLGASVDKHEKDKLDALTSPRITLKTIANIDHNEQDRIEFYNLNCALRQNIMQYTDERDVKLKERYQFSIQENLNRMAKVRDISILKYKDLKSHSGLWKCEEKSKCSDLLVDRRKKILEIKADFEQAQERATKFL